MDALKFRKRPLFRQQAVDHFIGVHGDGRMPELLHPGWRRPLRVLQSVLAVSALIWVTSALMTLSGDGVLDRTGMEHHHD